MDLKNLKHPSSSKFLFIFLIIISFIPSILVQSSSPPPPGPPGGVSEILINKNFEYIPADNVTICYINIIPIDSNGNKTQTQVWVISTLEGSYIKDIYGNWVLQPHYLIFQANAANNYTVNISFKSKEEGTAIINITAQTCSNYTQIEVINASIISFNYTFYHGWNLISIPLLTSFQTAEDFLQNCSCFDTIAKWDGNNQSYIVHPKEGPNNFELKNGIGYFLYVINETNYTIEGYFPFNITINLYEGWNLIGWKKENITAEELANSILYCDCIAMWDNLHQKWKVHPKGGPNNFLIKKGMGIFIHLNNDTSWIN